MITKYVVGFCFDNPGFSVVLIRKNRPSWQAGKLNGVGGHVEPFDKSAQWAMAREFGEETGVTTQPESWDHFASLLSPHSDVAVFRKFNSSVLKGVKTITDETIQVINTDPVDGTTSRELVPNLKFLIPLALHTEVTKPVTIEYPQ